MSRSAADPLCLIPKEHYSSCFLATSFHLLSLPRRCNSPSRGLAATTAQVAPAQLQLCTNSSAYSALYSSAATAARACCWVGHASKDLLCNLRHQIIMTWACGCT
jgi:hypothetical protein